MAAILNSAKLDSDTAILIISQTFAHKELHSFILTQLDDCSYLEICHPQFSHFVQKKLHSFILTQLDDGSQLELCNLGFSHFAQKNFTHSFWLNLMMAAILYSAILDSDTAILDSNTLLSSLRFTQNTLPPLWLWLKQIQSDKLKDGIHSWILQSWWWWPSWIQPFCTKLWLKVVQSDSNSIILNQLDNGSHLEFCHLQMHHVGFSHLSFSSQTDSDLPR